jgi:hypothetical protein
LKGWSRLKVKCSGVKCRATVPLPTPPADGSDVGYFYGSVIFAHLVCVVHLTPSTTNALLV